MSNPTLDRFKALIFDCYGTLIDWETGIYTALQPLLASSKWSREEALKAFVSVELDIQAKNPQMAYSDVLAAAYDELSRRLKGAASAPNPSGTTVAPVYTSGGAQSSDVTTTTVAGTSSSSSEPPSTAEVYSDAAKTFAASIGAWPAFPDTIDALARLKTLGLQLIILSNVDRASFEKTRGVLEHGFAFDGVYTAEEIGSYKPNPNNHRFALAQIKSTPQEQVLAVAQSLVHDHVPAKSLGLHSVWIDRAGAYMGIDGDGVPEARDKKEAFPTWRFTTMGEFADAFEAAVGK